MKEIELAGLKFWITADDKKIDFDLKYIMINRIIIH